ncbi:MAG: hypothetical protein ACXV3E_04070 [Halobacteriota archaeon]
MPSPTATATPSATREFNITSRSGVDGRIIVNVNTGRFTAAASDTNFVPGTTHYLQWHVDGLAGAGVVGTAVARAPGTVSLGGIAPAQLALLK